VKRSQGLEPVARRRSGGFAGGINNRKYMGLTSTSRATAWRELSDLVAKGCLVPTGKGGRSSAYEIPWAELA